MLGTRVENASDYFFSADMLNSLTDLYIGEVFCKTITAFNMV